MDVITQEALSAALPHESEAVRRKIFDEANELRVSVRAKNAGSVEVLEITAQRRTCAGQTWVDVRFARWDADSVAAALAPAITVLMRHAERDLPRAVWVEFEGEAE